MHTTLFLIITALYLMCSHSVLPSAQAQDSTLLPSEQFGWQRAESVALVQVSGAWTLQQAADASQGGYHTSVQNGATLL